MLVDLKSLSAKELYELAQKKEYEEAALSALQQQITEKETLRDQLLSKQRGDLAIIDKHIRELTAKRKYLLEKHAQVAKLLDEGVSILKANYAALREVSEAQKGKQAVAPAVEGDATPREREGGVPVAEKANDEVLLAKAIIGTFKGRSYISDSLLKEKLTGLGFGHHPINAVLTAMLKQKSLLRKGSGTYVLGTVPASLR